MILDKIGAFSVGAKSKLGAAQSASHVARLKALLPITIAIDPELQSPAVSSDVEAGVGEGIDCMSEMDRSEQDLLGRGYYSPRETENLLNRLSVLQSQAEMEIAEALSDLALLRSELQALGDVDVAIPLTGKR